MGEVTCFHLDFCVGGETQESKLRRRREPHRKETDGAKVVTIPRLSTCN